MSKAGTIWTIVIIIVLIIIGVLVYKGSESSSGNGMMATTTAETTSMAGAGTTGQSSTAMPAGMDMGSSTMTSTTTPVSSTTKGPVVLTAVNSGTLGTYLVAANGMTVYTDSKDSVGVSTCTGSCASAWPPYTVAGSFVSFTGGTGVRGAISAITLPDGTKQITYNGLPLYFWQGDKAAGDTNGNGVGGFAIVRE